MAGGDVFLDIVRDEMAVAAQKIAAQLRQWQQVVLEGLDLQGPVHQVCGKAGLAKGKGGSLYLIEDA